VDDTKAKSRTKVASDPQVRIGLIAVAVVAIAWAAWLLR
jgi:hypothetical protein